jgi:hypothetical protein
VEQPLGVLMLRHILHLFLLFYQALLDLLLSSDQLPSHLVILNELLVAVLARRPVGGVRLEV